MAISTYQELSWDNPQTFYISQIWSLYCRDIDWEWQLCNVGYHGYADPRFSSAEPNPDVLAFHPQGDVQHVHIKSFPSYEFGSDEATDKQKIRDVISGVSEAMSIPDETVTTYLSKRGHDFTPETQEVVCVLPNDVYTQYESYIDQKIEDENLILWLVKPNGKTEIWKETGNHSNLTLDTEMESRLKAYPSSNDLLQYTRSTSQDRLKYEFIQRLARHCGRMNKLSFTFEKADEVMIKTHPPILGHLPEADRKDDYWADFLWSMLNRFDLLEQSEEEPDRYVWTRKRFVREPRYRRKILRNVRDELGLDGGGLQ